MLPTSIPTRTHSRLLLQPWKRPATSPARTSRSRSTAAVSDWYNEEDKCYHLPKRGTVMTSEQMVDMWEGFVDKYPIISIEDGMGEDDWEGWQLMTKRLGHKHPDRRRRPVRHQHRAHQEGYRSGRSKRSPHQGKPDRHPDRDSRCYPDGSPRRLDGSCLPPLRRDRGYHHCRYLRRRQRRPDQDRRTQPHRPRLPSTTSCSASRTSCSTSLSTPAWTHFSPSSN